MLKHHSFSVVSPKTSANKSVFFSKIQPFPCSSPIFQIFPRSSRTFSTLKTPRKIRGAGRSWPRWILPSAPRPSQVVHRRCWSPRRPSVGWNPAARPGPMGTMGKMGENMGDFEMGIAGWRGFWSWLEMVILRGQWWESCHDFRGKMNGNMADGWGDFRWKILGKLDGENGWEHGMDWGFKA